MPARKPYIEIVHFVTETCGDVNKIVPARKHYVAMALLNTNFSTIEKKIEQPESTILK